MIDNKFTPRNYELKNMFMSLLDAENNEMNILYIGYDIDGIISYLNINYNKSNVFSIELPNDSQGLDLDILDFKVNNINKINFSCIKDFFDYIFIEEILDKSYSPREILTALYSSLKNNGVLISSSYNVSNINVINNLISGNFYYNSDNIPKNNINFFTLLDLNTLFADINFAIDNIYLLSDTINSSNQSLITKLNKFYSPQLIDEFLAKRYIIKAKKNITDFQAQNKIYENYIRFLLNKNSDLSEFESLKNKGYKLNENDPKLIAYYLPQFHLTKENNQWWGRGTTEWDNVTRAIPQYTGHYQPRLPKDLGFYNLEMKTTLERQIELAKYGGIYGFAIYYYNLSNDKKFLRKPLDILLDNEDLDFPFCLYWANEDWKKGYVSVDDGLLAKQFTSYEEYRYAIHDMSKYLNDKRYIKINEKKLIMIYKPLNIPNTIDVFNYWRKYCLENNLGEIYIMATKDDNINDLDSYYKNGFDGVNEFTPINEVYDYIVINDNINFIGEFNGVVFDYKEYVENKKYLKNSSNKIYKCVIPGWDNTPRKANKSFIFKDSSPMLYYNWLSDVINSTKNNSLLDDNIIFINAWNEWGEGAILEPCTHYGYAYLNKTIKSLEEET